MALFDKKYISVCDPAVSDTTYVHIHSTVISENIKTDYLQYGNIENKELSFVKNKNAYTGEISTNFRPWESRFFLRSFFGIAKQTASTEIYYLTVDYNPINIKVANGDTNTVGVDDEFITLNYFDILINKIDITFKAKELTKSSFSYIAKSVDKINDLDVTYTLPIEDTCLYYKMSITLTSNIGTAMLYDDIASCKISMNNGGANDFYKSGTNEPSTIRKTQQQSGVITFDYNGYSTDNFAIRLNDLDCDNTYTVYIEVTDRFTDAVSCSFTFNNCVVTETNRSLNRARDATKSVMLIADLTDMAMVINNKTYEPIVANFTVQQIDTTTCSFINNSTGDIDDAYWDFGDGETSTVYSPAHTFQDEGYYIVTLYVNNETDISSLIKTVNISGITHADYTYTRDDLTVQFENLSTGTINSYYWTFGDGETSTEQNPIHTYDYEGDYYVFLTVYDNFGVDDDTYEIVLVYLTVVPSFIYSYISPSDPPEYMFSNTTSGYYASVEWDFGDGSAKEYDNNAVSHTFPDFGEYVVSLSVIDYYGVTTITEETIDI